MVKKFNDQASIDQQLNAAKRLADSGNELALKRNQLQKEGTELQILIRRMYIELKQFEKENRNTEAVELRQRLADSTSKSSQLKSEYNNLEDQALRKRREAIGKLSVVIEELEENEK